MIRFSILIELAGYDGWESMEIARMECTDELADNKAPRQ